jgi:DNA-binding transcriptional MerR regulator
VQKAAEEANAELNDVAQRIRYVGLSADEIRAILTATEAELAMDKTRDNTETRSALEDIADMIGEIVLEKQELISTHIMSTKRFNTTQDYSFLSNVLAEGNILV